MRKDKARIASSGTMRFARRARHYSNRHGGSCGSHTCCSSKLHDFGPPACCRCCIIGSLSISLSRARYVYMRVQLAARLCRFEIPLAASAIPRAPPTNHTSVCVWGRPCWHDCLDGHRFRMLHLDEEATVRGQGLEGQAQGKALVGHSTGHRAEPRRSQVGLHNEGYCRWRGSQGFTIGHDMSSDATDIMRVCRKTGFREDAPNRNTRSSCTRTAEERRLQAFSISLLGAAPEIVTTIVDRPVANSTRVVRNLEPAQRES